MVLQFEISTGRLLKEMKPLEHFKLKIRVCEGLLISSHNTPEKTFSLLSLSKINERDTLYHIDMKNNKYIPVFTMTFSSDSSTCFYRDANIEQYLKPAFYQLNKDVILSLILEKGFIIADLKSRTSSWVRFVNDYYGNINIPTIQFYMYFRNGFFIHYMTSEELKKNIQARLSERNCTEQDRQMLKKTLSSLKKETNIVVFIGKLKSETELW